MAGIDHQEPNRILPWGGRIPTAQREVFLPAQADGVALAGGELFQGVFPPDEKIDPIDGGLLLGGILVVGPQGDRGAVVPAFHHEGSIREERLGGEAVPAFAFVVKILLTGEGGRVGQPLQKEGVRFGQADHQGVVSGGGNPQGLGSAFHAGGSPLDGGELSGVRGEGVGAEHPLEGKDIILGGDRGAIRPPGVLAKGEGIRFPVGREGVPAGSSGDKVPGLGQAVQPLHGVVEDGAGVGTGGELGVEAGHLPGKVVPQYQAVVLTAAAGGEGEDKEKRQKQR